MPKDELVTIKHSAPLIASAILLLNLIDAEKVVNKFFLK